MHDVGVGVSRGNEMTKYPNETWCTIDRQYKTITVSEDQPGTFVCRIPRLSGANVFLVNQYGYSVLDNLTLAQYVHVDPSVHDLNNSKSYRFDITWTEDRNIQEQLRVIQCRANFQKSVYTRSTPMVSINFATGEQGASLLSYNCYVKIIYEFLP